MEPSQKQHQDFIAFKVLEKKCHPKKDGVTGLIVKHLQKAFQRPISLQLSSPMALSQCCSGSCPNLITSKNEAHEKPEDVGSVAQQPSRTPWSLCLSLPSEGEGQFNHPSPQNKQNGLQARMDETQSRGVAHSTWSPVKASLSCALRSSSTSDLPLTCPVDTPSKAKLSSRFSLFLPPSWSSSSELASNPLPSASSKKSRKGTWKKNLHPEDPSGLKPGEPVCFHFKEPIIARITDCIYLGNLNAAYSGRALCKNSIDSIIDMSSLPSDCSLSIIPCTCGRGGFKHSWSRLKVDIHASLDGDHRKLGQPCFQDINECIDASLEKGKRVLIHCRDGYSLGPACVIQYLMVKHNMRLLTAYEFVRARYPLNIQGCHQDMLVGLETSLQPGDINMAGLKHSLSRRMAWS